MSIHVNDDGDPNTVTCLFTDLLGKRIEELPLTNVSFSLTLNGSGPFSGTLAVEDPRVLSLNWLAATAPNLAQVWIDIGGTLVYGGLVTDRGYDMNGSVSIKAADHWGYLTHRLQANDYSTNWATTPTGAAQIAYTVVTDALAVANSLPISVAVPAVTPAQYGITLAAPISQRMTVDSIVNQVSALGWLVGFDYAIDVAYVAGVPTATLNMAYPRRGRIAGTTGLVIDTQSALAFKYDESGGSQATKVTEVSTGSGGVATAGQWTPANTVDGYPLLERVGSHASFSAAAIPQTVLNAYVANDLALSAYPVVTPQITMPMFAEPAIGEWIVGDDVRVIVPKTAGSGPPLNPRFPSGMDFYWRITRADCSVPTEGVPTVTYTFNMPPSSTPQRPPR